MEEAYLLGDLLELQENLWKAIAAANRPILPDLESLERCRDSIYTKLPQYGIGVDTTRRHLLEDIIPGLNQASLSSRYYGFVTGGITTAARLGESVVSTYDQNVQVHLPEQTIATLIEARSLELLLELLHFEQREWLGVFTTGATAGNILGLGLAREYLVNKALEKATGGVNTEDTVGKCGLLHACQLAKIKGFLIFTTKPHSSLVKAASILGFGRESIVDVGNEGDNLVFDLASLESAMIEHSHDHGLIIAVSCGEINTGFFATDGEMMQNLRTLSDRYGAWLHVDGAFGIFARVLDEWPGFEGVAKGAAGLELADSIAGDGHKMLNVPYDCGFFFHRHPGLAEQVFQNANAAYLNAGGAAPDAIRSPLNIGLENSRRFRALPVYTTLVAYGRSGYADMLSRQVRLARAVATLIVHHSAFDLLPFSIAKDEDKIQQDVFIIVLFKAKDDRLNEELTQRINATSMIYVSGTMWDAAKASRIAVANWQAQPERDLPVVEEALNKVVQDWEQSMLTQ